MSLIELIKKAQGERSQNQYAMQCGVSSAAITKIIKGERNPAPDFLRKLSEQAYNGVTYDDFMVAAGYLDESHKHYVDAVPDKVKTTYSAFDKIVSEGITREEVAAVVMLLREEEKRKKDIEKQLSNINASIERWDVMTRCFELLESIMDFSSEDMEYFQNLVEQYKDK